MYGEEGLIMAYLILCSGLTSAQHIKKVLARSCIGGYIVRPPQEIAAEGCGYAVEVKESQFESAVRIIRDCRLTFRKVFRKDGTMYTEVSV